SAETYLRDASGAPTFAALAGFASGTSFQLQQHWSHSVGLKFDPRGPLAVDASASVYRMDRDRQRLPTTARSSGTTFGTPGRVAVLDGTGWLTFDAKATWRPMGLADKGATHVVSFGLHVDHYTLRNPTFNTLDWRAGRPISSVATEGDGKTRTQ